MSAFLQSTQPSVLFTWLYAVACALQIYFDFSGYSDMAVGPGRIFGFHFPENFRLPLPLRQRHWGSGVVLVSVWAAGSGTTSISRWGAAAAPQPLALNVFLVWGLTGLWHGAAWNFVLWGLFFRRPAGGRKSCGTATGWKRPGS